MLICEEPLWGYRRIPGTPTYRFHIMNWARPPASAGSPAPSRKKGEKYVVVRIDKGHQPAVKLAPVHQSNSEVRLCVMEEELHCHDATEEVCRWCTKPQFGLRRAHSGTTSTFAILWPRCGQPRIGPDNSVLPCMRIARAGGCRYSAGEREVSVSWGVGKPRPAGRTVATGTTVRTLQVVGRVPSYTLTVAGRSVTVLA